MYIIHKSIYIYASYIYTLRSTNTVQEIRSTNTVQDIQNIMMKTPESSEMERGLELELWEEEGGWSGGVLMRDLNISYNEKML